MSSKTSRRRKKPGAPPQDENWVWLSRSMVEQARILSIHALRLLLFLNFTHMEHGGKMNGELQAPYSRLVKWGIRRQDIASAIAELEAFGWIECKRGAKISGNRREPNTFRLTWLETAETPRTWWRMSDERAARVKADLKAVRGQRRKSASDRRARRTRAVLRVVGARDDA